MNRFVSKAKRVIINSMGLKTFDYNKFIVIGRARTGSNLLMGSLNAHPYCTAKFEEFGKEEHSYTQKDLDDVFSEQPAYIKAVGFKIFYYHALPKGEGLWERTGKGEIWESLLSDKEIKVIHLKRKNYLDTLISLKVAEKRNQWHQKNYEQEEPTEVEISTEDCAGFFEETEKYEKVYDGLFENHSVKEIGYEDLKNSFLDTIGTAQKFIGLKAIQLKPPFRKQRTMKNREYVKNYDALKAHFQHSKWASFFE